MERKMKNFFEFFHFALGSILKTFISGLLSLQFKNVDSFRSSIFLSLSVHSISSVAIYRRITLLKLDSRNLAVNCCSWKFRVMDCIIRKRNGLWVTMFTLILPRREECHATFPFLSPKSWVTFQRTDSKDYVSFRLLSLKVCLLNTGFVCPL